MTPTAELELCPWCGSDSAAAGSTCPKSLACPRCHAAAGSPCRRPSGHRAMVMHAERIATAEQADLESGLTWPT